LMHCKYRLITPGKYALFNLMKIAEIGYISIQVVIFG